ncbi:Uncharacterised protein [Vibrio cholerae]|nr:Uncharacterised protein [Vibrio cholerae]CSB34521.1 Uncharacterised protein [Vibrio cholerae]CSC58959.1 Uncharacterised protein [Vibrio cholerae]CSI58529.1 Uncharacterised protein [Vibrio cholerae]
MSDDAFTDVYIALCLNVSRFNKTANRNRPRRANNHARFNIPSNHDITFKADMPSGHTDMI